MLTIAADGLSDLMAVMPYPSQPPKPAKAEKKEEGGKKVRAMAVQADL